MFDPASHYYRMLDAKLDIIHAQGTQILARLDAISKQETKSMSAISDAVAALTAKAASIQSTEDAALAALNGLRDQLKAAIANAADSDAAVTAVNSIVGALDTHNAPLAAAIATPPA